MSTTKAEINLDDYYIAEYRELKKEQVKRIGFRDNLIYVMLGLFGAILSFSLTNENNNHALLITPIVGLIIGWTYLNNDKKISHISEYIREELIPKASEDTGIFGWENVNKNKSGRGLNKFIQACVDIFTFAGTGALSLFLYDFLETNQIDQALYTSSWIITILTSLTIIIYNE